MRHRKAHRHLSLPTDKRMALLKSVVGSLFLRERVVTTWARAKESRSMAEKLITLAKEDTVTSRRLVRRLLPAGMMVKEHGPRRRKERTRLERAQRQQARPDAPEVRLPEVMPNVLHKLFDDIAPRYEDRSGGYTRIVPAGVRRGDGAQLAVLMLVE